MNNNIAGFPATSRSEELMMGARTTRRRRRSAWGPPLGDIRVGQSVYRPLVTTAEPTDETR
jgi:hypothetical protein